MPFEVRVLAISNLFSLLGAIGEKKGSNLEENDMWAHCIHADAQIQQVVNFGEQSFGL